MRKPVKVLVIVKGGTVLNILSEKSVALDIVVVDYDNINAGDPGPEALFFADEHSAADFMQASTTEEIWF